MLFFLICADDEVGRRECRERGWTQAGITRFWTPERHDVRIVRRWSVDFALMPGGTWFMAGPDFHLNPNAEDFLKLVEGGQAKWLPGEEPPGRSMPIPGQQTQELLDHPTEQVEEPEPPMDREILRERFQAELERRRSSGARPGRPALPR